MTPQLLDSAQNLVNLLRGPILTAFSIGAVPTLEATVETIKYWYKNLLKSDMPGFLVTIVSLVVSYLGSALYAIFVTGTDLKTVIGSSVILAGLSSIYHNKTKTVDAKVEESKQPDTVITNTNVDNSPASTTPVTTVPVDMDFKSNFDGQSDVDLTSPAV